MNKEFRKIIFSGKTIFSVNSLGKYLCEYNDTALRKKISYYLKVEYLKRLTRGLYALSGIEVNPMYAPSYISFETAQNYIHKWESTRYITKTTIHPTTFLVTRLIKSNYKTLAV